ncbi:MAG: cytidine deaminase [Bacteroidales bacterium]|nr:cytidine deaminase [Bacteroidales bacterium]
MREINLPISYFEYDHPEELSNEDQELLQKAEQIASNAYAPYSGFFVGSAVLLENGEIYAGSNQENVAFPSGLCAERVALFYATSRYPDIPVKSIAITAKSGEFVVKDPVTPCGACRQVMAEIEIRFDNPIRLILKGATNKVLVVKGINNMLPLMFQAKELKI